MVGLASGGMNAGGGDFASHLGSFITMRALNMSNRDRIMPTEEIFGHFGDRKGCDFGGMWALVGELRRCQPCQCQVVSESANP